MRNCASFDQILTSYVDGEASAADARAVEQHIEHCGLCRSKVGAERAMRGLLGTHRATLRGVHAPASLHARCRQLAADHGPAAATMNRERTAPVAGASPAFASRLRRAPASVLSGWRAAAKPVAIAASLVVVVVGAFLYRMTHTSELVIARELTADHVKCFLVNAVLGTRQSAAAVESSLASRFGWQAHLPSNPEHEELELVGERPCLYGEGRVAHIMYRHQGKPVSVFMLTGAREPEALLDVMGHQAVFWSQGERTFVLIARESEEEVKKLAAFLHDTLR
jgi:anti-sigma factor RsiW